MQKAQVRRILNNCLFWDVAVNNGATILQARDIEVAYNIFFGDATIVSAAYMKRAEIPFNEDLKEGQQREGMTIVNPILK
jgi:predicted nucleic acid-binding protein